MALNKTERNKTTICLFDVDGTLTSPRQVGTHSYTIIKECIIFILSKLKENYTRDGRIYGTFEK